MTQMLGSPSLELQTSIESVAFIVMNKSLKFD